MVSMVRRIVACTVIGALALAFTVGANAQEKKKDDKEKKPASIKEVMKKMNNKKTGFPAKANEAAAAGKWEDAVKAAKEAKEFGEALGKNDPPKGEKESWEKLTKEYAENAKGILDAAEKKDAAEVKKLAEIWTTNKNCGSCHKNHKP